MKRLYHVMLFLVSLMLIGCGDWDNNQWGERVEPYPVINVTKGNYESFREYPTKLEGVQNFEVRAKIGGYVNKILVEEGAVVKAGTPLINLETTSLTQDAKAAKARMETARIEVERLKPLVENNIVSEIQLKTAEANLASAKGSYESLLANIRYAKIVSPVNGVVGKINFKKGSLVGPSTQLPLTTVSDIEKVYSYFSVNEKELLELTNGLNGNSINEKISQLPNVKLRMANDELYNFEGEIEVSTGEINSSTGAIFLRAAFENPTGILRNGSSGVIEYPIFYNNVIAIPAMATFNQQGTTFVFVINKENKLDTRRVEVIGNSGRYLIIGGGINVNEKILAQGLGKLRPGSEIIPQVVAMDSIANSYSKVFK